MFDFICLCLAMFQSSAAAEQPIIIIVD